jgi:hypothetical protein
MKRRTFILTAAAAGTAVAIAIVLKWNKGSKWEKSPLKYPLILSIFCDEETLRNIGNGYISRAPAENSTEKLTALLTAQFKAENVELSDSFRVASEVEIQAEDDFKKSRYLILDSWIISETEARQCALLSLS